MLTDVEQVLEAFDSRKATFPTLRDWQVRPVYLHAPSDMQDLLSYAAETPFVLEATDSLADRCHQGRPVAGRRLYYSFREVLVGLERWKQSFRHNTPNI